jgi:hypothetical protein
MSNRNDLPQPNASNFNQRLRETIQTYLGRQGDPLDRGLTLRDLVRGVWRRYGGEVLVSETAHVGPHRGPWLAEVAHEAEALLRQGVKLRGVCLYPILGMPEWHAPDVWTPMGLWDPVCHRTPHGARLVCEPMLEALRAVGHLGRALEDLPSAAD